MALNRRCEHFCDHDTPPRVPDIGSQQMMDESARLLTHQQQLEKEADGKITFFGLSVNETLRTLLINGMAKRADKVKSDFKVPDKRCVARG